MALTAADLRERTRALLAEPRRRVEVQVFVAGAGIMVLEMLAGRLLAPRFGSTVFTWGALIGVVMTALALGYALGGRLADRRPHGWLLSALLLGAGAFALLMPFFAPLSLAAIAGAVPDPRWGPLVASLAIIAPPCMVLGAATPVAVRLAAGPAERAGSVAGHMASVGTVGSILGTFGTVFVLIPVFSVEAILTGAGATLGAAALLTREGRGNVALALATLVILSPLGQVALGSTLSSLQTGITDEVLYHKSTPYHELYVTEPRVSLGRETRSLILDGNHHSAMFVDDPPETPIRYVEHFHLGPLLNPDATRALFIGGGGMSGPKQFLEAYPNMTLDVVELDPDVVDVARRYFAVPEDPRLAVHALDGRQFLERAGEAQWDVVILDAYGRNYVPFHLMTAEFLSLVASHLAPGGVVVSNVIGSAEGPTSLLLRSEARTFEATFGWVRPSFTHPEYGGLGVQNVLLVAAAQEPPGLAGARERAAAWDQDKAGRRYGQVFSTLGAGGLRTDDVPIFTDNFAPVEAYISPLTGRPYDPSG